MLRRGFVTVILFLSCHTLIYGQIPELSRPYDAADTIPQTLDFVYHNHEEMTNFLR